MNFANAFTPERLQEAWKVLQTEFPFAIWETIYSTLLATFMAIVIGLPLGVILVTGEQKGIRPLPRGLMTFLNLLINLLRSVPFIILMVMIIPLTRVIVGTSVGTMASVVPLTVAAFPFISRLVESSLREVNPNIIETAQSMGATPMQIILHVLLPEFYFGDNNDYGLHGNEWCSWWRRSGKACPCIWLPALSICSSVLGSDCPGDYYPADSVLWHVACTQMRQAT